MLPDDCSFLVGGFDCRAVGAWPTIPVTLSCVLYLFYVLCHSCVPASKYTAVVASCLGVDCYECEALMFFFELCFPLFSCCFL